MLRIVATWHAEIQWLSSPRLYRCREHLSQLGPGFECDIQEIPPRKFPYEPSAPYRWRRVTIWADQASHHLVGTTDRKSVVSGKSVSVRLDLGCRRIIKKQKDNYNHSHYILY